MIQDVQEEPRHYRKKFKEFGKWIVYLCVFILVGYGISFRMAPGGGKLIEVFLIAVNASVQRIPEGLPA